MTDPIRNKQIDFVFKQLKNTGIPHVVTVTTVAGYLWYDSPSSLIVAWFFMLHFAHAMRILFLDSLWEKKRLTGNYQQLCYLLVAGMFVAGLLWGLVPAFMMNDPSKESFLLISVAVAGISASALPALGAFWPAFVALITPILLITTAKYFYLGLFSSSILSFSMWVALLVISVSINRIITRSITIDVKNHQLLGEVTVAKEKAEQANQAKSKFLAAASHDLRQPLHALGLILESLKFRIPESDKDIREILQRGMVSHESLSSLFNALLELSRLESHKLEVQRIHFALMGFVNSVVNEFRPMAEEKQLMLNVKGDACVVETDPVLFGRILRNLLTNAIKFTQQGSICIDIQAQHEYVILSVTDTGIGIPQDEQEKVFDEYHQIESEVRNRNMGIGLGLSVVSKMCELLNHNIHLHSELGLGSCFSISLPLGMVEKISASEEYEEHSIKEYQVLVVDDDAEVLDALATLLQDWNCKPHVADSIEKAQQLIKTLSLKPDIILSDYRLSNGGTGIDAIEAIRATLNVKIPALLMTGDTDPELVTAIREKSFFLLHKPVKPTHLRNAMRKLMAMG